MCLKWLKNDRGYALVLVLFAIVLISILGLSLYGSTISTAKQVNRADSYYRSYHIAEMGVTYTKNNIVSYILNETTAPNLSSEAFDIEQYINQMFFDISQNAKQRTSDCAVPNQLPNEVVIDCDYPNRKYEIPSSPTIHISDDLNEAELVFSIIGKDAEREKELVVTMSLRGFGSGSSDDDIDNIEDLFPDEENLPGDWIIENDSQENIESGTIDGNVWMEGETDFEQTELQINGDVVVNGDFNSKSNPNGTSLTVCGNANFKGDVSDGRDKRGEDGFKGMIEIGNHAYFEKSLEIHQMSYKSGGNTYIKGGIALHQVDSFTVGGDFKIDIKNGTYDFGSTVANVQGNFIIENYNSVYSNKLIGTLHVGEDVLVYNEQGELISPFILSTFKRAIIQDHYDFGEDTTLFDTNSSCPPPEPSAPTDEGGIDTELVTVE